MFSWVVAVLPLPPIYHEQFYCYLLGSVLLCVYIFSKPERYGGCYLVGKWKKHRECRTLQIVLQHIQNGNRQLNSPESRDAFTLACHSCNQVTVDDHDSFGSACGATGIHHHSQVGRLGLHNLPHHYKTNRFLKVMCETLKKFLYFTKRRLNRK